jgi:hypothetical protein
MKAAPASIDRHLLMMGLAAVILAGAGQTRVTVAGEGKVVFADDFETPSAHELGHVGRPARQSAHQLHARHR